jgi:hypothetical protein
LKPMQGNGWDHLLFLWFSTWNNMLGVARELDPIASEVSDLQPSVSCFEWGFWNWQFENEAKCDRFVRRVHDMLEILALGWDVSRLKWSTTKSPDPMICNVVSSASPSPPWNPSFPVEQAPASMCKFKCSPNVPFQISLFIHVSESLCISSLDPFYFVIFVNGPWILCDPPCKIN